MFALYSFVGKGVVWVKGEKETSLCKGMSDWVVATAGRDTWGKVARCPWPGTELTGMDVSCLRYTKTHLSHLEHNSLTRTQNSERISFKNYISLTRSKIHIHTHIFTRIGLSYAHTFLSFRHPQFNIQLWPSFHINKSDVRT